MKHFPQFEIGDWVITKDDRCVQITHNDMPDLTYEDIVRPATMVEIKEAKSDLFMQKNFLISKGIDIPSKANVPF